mgnify:CR=1 FL=1
MSPHIPAFILVLVMVFTMGLAAIPNSSAAEERAGWTPIRLTAEPALAKEVKEAKDTERGETGAAMDAEGLQFLAGLVESGDLDGALAELETLVGPWRWLRLDKAGGLKSIARGLAMRFLGDGAREKALRALSAAGRATRSPVDYLYSLAESLDEETRARLWGESTPYLYVEHFGSAAAVRIGPIYEGQGRPVNGAELNAGAASLELGASTKEGPSRYGLKTPGFLVSRKAFGLRIPAQTEPAVETRLLLKYWMPVPERSGEFRMHAPAKSKDGWLLYDSGRETAGIRQEIVHRNGLENFRGAAFLEIGLELPPGPAVAVRFRPVEVYLPEDWAQRLEQPVPSAAQYKWEFNNPQDIGWKVSENAQDLRVSGGILHFKVGDKPVRLQTAHQDLNADFVNCLEVRMRVKPAEKTDRSLFSWAFVDYDMEQHGGSPFGEPREYPFTLRRDGEFHTYRLNLQEGYDLDWWGLRSAFCVQPTDRKGAEVDIDYIAFARLNSDELRELSKIDPGRDRRGVGTRSSIYTTDEYDYVFPLRLDGPAVFEAGASVLDYPLERADDMLEFQVLWREGGGETLIYRYAAPAQERRKRFGWEQMAADLSAYAGRSGALVLRTVWSRDEQAPAPPHVAAWGSPVVWKREGPPKKNVLLICCDTLRADALGCYGYEKEDISPYIDALAAESVVFDRAYAPAPWTWHSIASMLSSLYVRQYSKAVTPFVLPEAAETVAETFREAGYMTACFSLNGWISEQTGCGQGFDVFYDLVTHLDLQMEGTYSERATEPVMHWLDQNKEKPFFVYVHYLDPHAPFKPPRWTRGRYTGGTKGIDWVAQTGKGNWVAAEMKKTGEYDMSEESFQYMRDLYDEEILGVDEHVGRLMESLEMWGILDNTIVVMFADHGEEFLEHGYFGHGMQCYNEIARVPLLIRVPGVAPTRVDKVCSLVDVGPTLAHLAGVPAMDKAEGVSLFPLEDNAAFESRDMVLVEMLDYFEYWQYAAVTRDWKYMNWIGEKERVVRSPTAPGTNVELYDMANDFDERNNLVDEKPDLAAELKTRAEALMQELDARDLLAPGEDGASEDRGLTDSQMQKLKALGYLE